MPDQTHATYTPASPEALLSRAKARSTELRRHWLVTAAGSIAVVVALVLGIVIFARPTTQPSVVAQAGHVGVTAHVGSAEELTAVVARAAAPSPAERKEVSSEEVGFSLQLLDQLSSGGGAGNLLASPSSLSTALTMLELGAKGSTAQGIADTLDAAGVPPSVQAAGWDALSTLLTDETSRTGAHLGAEAQLDIANAVWVEDNLDVEPGFVRAMSSEFGAGVWQVDFSGDLPGALASINQWTAHETQGLIKQLFSPGALTAQTALVLADAVYFQAHWAHAFSELSAPFHFADGSTSDLPTIQSSVAGGDHPVSLPYVLGNGYEAAEIPYAGKKMSALVVMPTTGSLAGYVHSMTPSSLTGIVSALQNRPVRVTLPEFTITADNRLNSVLSNMGMSDAFSPGADFRGITTQIGLQVEAVEQRAYLQVTPLGTKAAAATGVGVEPSSTRIVQVQELEFNRPFLFLVRDDATGAILFESMVQRP
ncbi:MAG: serpin family protein [Acidimicrobiales bacterium]